MSSGAIKAWNNRLASVLLGICFQFPSQLWKLQIRPRRYTAGTPQTFRSFKNLLHAGLWRQINSIAATMAKHSRNAVGLQISKIFEKTFFVT